MKIKQILKKYQKRVPFPITPRKIRAAGYDITQYLTELIAELKECEDSNDPLVRQLKEQALPESPL